MSTRRFVFFVLWIEAALVLWAASFGGSAQAALGDPLLYGDKILHFLAFGALGLSALWLWKSTRFVLLILALFAVVVEAGQHLLPERTMSLHDLAASMAGLAAAWALMETMSALRARRHRAAHSDSGTGKKKYPSWKDYP